MLGSLKRPALHRATLCEEGGNPTNEVRKECKCDPIRTPSLRSPSILSSTTRFTSPLNRLPFKRTLLPRRDKLSLLPSIIIASTGACHVASVPLGVALDSGLEFRSEMADQPLEGPGERFA